MAGFLLESMGGELGGAACEAPTALRAQNVPTRSPINRQPLGDDKSSTPNKKTPKEKPWEYNKQIISWRTGERGVLL